MPHVAVLLALLAALVGGAALAPAATSYFDGGPVPLLAPQLSGDPRVGQTLTCERGTWDDSEREPYAVDYAWFHGDGWYQVDAGPTHEVGPWDVGQDLTCAVTARDGWRTTTVSSRPHHISGPQVRIAPALTGDDRVGGALRCSRGVWDDAGLPVPYPVTYGWLRDGEPIEDATGARHVVTREDAGHELRCVVIAAEASAATSGSAFPDGPRNHVAPSVGGDPRPGGTLTCAPGGWDGAYTLAHAWLRDGEPIPLATGSTYVAGPLDAGHDLACRVVAEALTTVDSAPVRVDSPQARTAPEITGDLRVGGTLRCEPGAWDGEYAFTYAWSRGGDAPTRVNAAADVGEPLTCTVTAAGLAAATSAPVLPTAPVARNVPAIDGDVRLGRTLTCDPGAWDGPYALAIEWRRGETVLGSDATHTVGPEDVGGGLRCRVTAAALTVAESRTAFVPAPRVLAAPAIAGDPRPGATLTCNPGTWDGDYAFAYEWFAGDLRVGTARTQTAGAAGTAYRCLVAVGDVVAESAPVTVSEPAAGTPQNRTAPVISGTPRLGATLTCEPGTWNGDYTFAYAFERDGAPLAPGRTRVVGVEDLGAALTCTATTDGVTAESAAVVPGAPIAVAAPTVKGHPRLGRTLTCDPGRWDGDYTLTVAWVRAGDPAGAGATRTVTADDLGQALECQVSVGPTTVLSAAVTATAPVNRAAPALSGDPRVGATLTCGTGTWDDEYPVQQRWRLDGTLVASGASYVPETAGATLHCESSAGGVIAASRSVVVRPPTARTAPVVSGTPRLRGELTCTPGAWDGSYSFTFRWLRAGSEIATGATYAPVAADVGEALTCEVTAAGLTPAASAPVTITAPRPLTPTTIVGEPRIGATLTCTPGTWDADYALSVRWQHEGTPLGTGATYTVTVEDLGRELTCEVAAEGLETSAERTGPVTGPRALMAPVVSGDPVLRGTLRCSPGDWDGEYPLTYAWLREDGSSTGVTTPTYTVGREDLDRGLGCLVTAAGLETAASDLIQVDPPRALEGARIVGAPYPGRAVTCDPGRWNHRADAPYQFTYQWFHDIERLDPVPGGDGPTYVISAEDVGYTLTCVVTAEGEYVERASNEYIAWEDVALFLAPDDDSAAPGQANGYTVTLRNPNAVEAIEHELEFRLPAGFTFVPGSVTGLTTSDPRITDSGRRLAWAGSYPVPAGGEAKLHFRVTGASEPGHHFAETWAYSNDWDIYENGVYGGGRITVEGPAPTCTITGTAGDDVLVGTPGDDVICGLGGDDRISGGAGADTLLGGDGNDLLDGGAGADTIRGGGGLDTVTYATRTTPVHVTLGADEPDGTPELDGEPAEGDDVDLDVEIVRGGRGDDVLVGSWGDEELYGGPGDDELRGEGGDDLLDGGAGNDFVWAGDGRYTDVRCGAGLDTFTRDWHDRLAACEQEHFVPQVARR